MRSTLIFILMVAFGLSTSAQKNKYKLNGYGVELSVLSIKPNLRMWVTKNTGFEFFAGPAADLENFKPDDLEAGFKFLKTIQYKRTDRTYIGLMGKWRWVDVYDSNRSTSLPVPGIFVGKEWYSKRIKRKGFAIELGYQYAVKEYEVFSPLNHLPIGTELFEEFPLILNFRYSLYKKKK